MTLPQSTQALIAAIDWKINDLGPRERWPLVLEHALSICSKMCLPSVVFWGPQYIQLYNDAAIEVLGARHPAAFGQAARDCWPDVWETLGAQLDGVVAGGAALRLDACAIPPAYAGAPPTYFTIVHSPVDGGSGAVGGVFSIGVDMTAAVVRERAAGAGEREREFLAEASRLLTESLDLHITLRNVARMLVPHFADWCQIDLRTPEGRIQTVAIAHRDPHKDGLAKEFVGRVHLDPKSDRGNAFVIRTGSSDMIDELPASLLAELVGDDAELSRYQVLGTRSFAAVPLVAQGRTLGAVAAVYGDSGRRYCAADLPMLEELGRRAGLAVQNAANFDREHRVAQSFQEASLPAQLPRVPSMTFDAVYVPASDEAQIGGDWYDAMRLLDGRIVVSIGDVAGKGLRAAVTMGNMRQIIRGIAQVHADPALMLDAADRALRLEHPGQFVTAFVGVLDPIAKTFAYASAGHPPPLMRFLDGHVEALSDGGLPLGLREGRESTIGKVIDASRASAFVLYTDGLTELTRRPIDGEARLRALVADGEILHVEHPALALKRAIFADGIAADDVAILVIGLVAAREPAGGLPIVQHWSFDAGHAAVVQTVRHEIGAGLWARGAAFEDVFAAEMVFGELVGNIVRYAPGHAEVSVDWSAAAPVLHVLDRGPGFRHTAILPPDLFSESGRGLFLVTTLTDDFHVSKRPDGGSHARAVLSLARTRLERSTRIGPMFLDNAIGSS